MSVSSFGVDIWLSDGHLESRCHRIELEDSRKLYEALKEVFEGQALSEFEELLNAARILEVGDLDPITAQDSELYDRHQVARRIVKDLVKKHPDLIED